MADLAHCAIEGLVRSCRKCSTSSRICFPFVLEVKTSGDTLCGCQHKSYCGSVINTPLTEAPITVYIVQLLLLVGNTATLVAA